MIAASGQDTTRRVITLASERTGSLPRRARQVKHSTASAPRQPRRYVTLKSAAERLDCSERTLRRMIAMGELTGYRVGKRLIRVDADELDRLVRAIPTTGTVA